MFKQLTEAIAITFWWFDLRWILDREEACFAPINMHLPRGSERNHDVITLTEFEIPELRFQHTAAFMHPPRFISLGVAIEIIHAFGGATHAEVHIVVSQQDAACRDGVSALRRFGSGKGTVADRTEVHK